MAEGLFNALAPAGWEARSAGTDPQGSVRREAVEAMREAGIDISHHRPKSIAEALAPDLRLAIGLCAEEACPVIPGVASLHWPLPNPAGAGIALYRELRDDLSQRIRALIHDLTEDTL
jgi:protein-tyrosine-phosphatase